MEKNLAILTAIVCFLGMARVSSATLFSIDNPVFGADAITYDDESALYWLDLSLSANYSYDNIVAQTQVGGLFEGYHLADRSQIFTLFENAGLNMAGYENHDPNIAQENYEPAISLLELIGTIPLVDNPADGSMVHGFATETIIGPHMQVYGLHVYQSGFASICGSIYEHQPNINYSWIGGYMVRSAPVPEPSTIFLLSAGLAGLAVLKKVKKVGIS